MAGLSGNGEGFFWHKARAAVPQGGQADASNPFEPQVRTAKIPE
jgi:hypothetical protein